MKDSKPGIGLSAILLAGGLISALMGPVATLALNYGRLAGIVSDDHGNPLMGATVMIVGPLLTATAGTGDQVERVITNAKGKFSVGNLIPGWYSLQIVSPTRIPAHKNGVKVEAGQTSTLKFVLADAFSPLRFQVPDKATTPLGDDWKWVLRTSAATRPILRYHHDTQAQAATDPSSPTPADRRLIGVEPGPSGLDPMAIDQGMGTVFAYVRHLSPDSDMMTVGSLAADGSLTSSEGGVYRKGLISRDAEEVSLVIHQMGYTSGLAAPIGAGPLSDYEARGLVASYTQTCALDPHLTLTAGMDIDFLEAVRDLVIAQPRMRLAYHVSHSTDLALQLGREPYDDSDSLLERVNAVNAFPVLTLRGYQPEFEQLQHSEVSLNHRVTGSARLQIAAYHDGIKNAAVWSPAHDAALGVLAGNYLPNPAAGGVFVNMGDYRSTGYRVAYAQRLGNHVETLVAYFVGDSLDARGVLRRAPAGELQGALKPARSPSLAARVSARIPVTQTRLATSYEWVQSGRVTMVDPQGQADMQLQPFLDVQIRQPLPALAFLPAHIEAVADFRNFLGQGYAPVAQCGESPLLLGSAYKSIRGGLSVEF